jgi:hypothetical protein
MPREDKPVFAFNIDSHGLYCDPEVLFVHPGESITWNPPTGASSILIQCMEMSPFPETEHLSPGPFTLQVRRDASPGVYRFATAVAAGERVYMDARCPRLIVDL